MLLRREARKAELSHQRCDERFAWGACRIVKILPRGRRRLGNDHKPDAFRLVRAPEIEILVSLHRIACVITVNVSFRRVQTWSARALRSPCRTAADIPQPSRETRLLCSWAIMVAKQAVQVVRLEGEVATSYRTDQANSDIGALANAPDDVIGRDPQ
jgi:hypothetical protein